MLQIIKSFKQGILQRVFEDGGKFFLVVTTLNYFPFTRTETEGLLPDPDLWLLLSEEFPPDQYLDAGMPKPRGEALVYGKCYAPAGTKIQAAEPRLKIGNIDKQLLVFGERFWLGGGSRISEPVPFDCIPITYENSFGGEEHLPNPTGKGLTPSTTEEGEKIFLLPNIELPGKSIASRDDRPPPAGFGPYDITWPQRMDKCGTYTGNWFKERYPSYPTDMDWTMFNSAPEDQQTDEFWRGDEAFELHGMHPEKPVIRGTLPALRSRCFVGFRDEAGDETLKEIDLRADTVWFLPHHESGIIGYRGVTEVKGEIAENVSVIMIACEWQRDEPKSFAHYQDVLRRRRDPKKAHFHILKEADLTPLGEISFIDQFTDRDSPVVKGIVGEGILEQRMRAGLEKQLDKVEQKVAAMELPPEAKIDLPELREKFLAEPEKPSLEKLEAIDPEKIQEDIHKEIAEKKAEAEAKARELCEQAGMDYDQLKADAEKEGQRPPRLEADEKIALFRTLGVDNPGLEEKLREADEQLLDSRRLSAHMREAAPMEPPEIVRKLREKVIYGMTGNRDFSNQDLACVDLSGLSLVGAVFRNALLEGADFTGADLTDVDFTGCLLAHANFADATLTGLQAEGANLGRANLAGASLPNAMLKKSILMWADLTGADLTGANLRETECLHVEMTGAILAGADLWKSRFLRSHCSGVNFVGANLAETNWIESSVREADFTDAECFYINMIHVDGTRCNFTGANLTEMKTCGDTKFVDANFTGARLDKSYLGRLDMSGANFSESIINAADFSDSNLSRSTFSYARARDSSFARCDFEGADLCCFDLMRGSLRGARLVSADLGNSNMHAVDFMYTVFGETNLRGTLLTRTLLKDWHP